MMTQLLMAAGSPALLIVDAADFDGVNDYMLRGADLSGNADSKTGIFSGWVKNVASATQYNILANTGSKLLILYDGTGALDKFHLIARNAAATIILNIETSATIGTGTWYHLLASWNLATPITHLYVTDVSDKIETVATDDTIDYTVADWAIGANTAGSVKYDGDLAEVYCAPGQYLDFSLLANRRKFISPLGKPVHLGPTGANPTGVAPLIYQHLDNGEAVANFATNRGTGGNFTITGTLDTGSTSPSD
jgi:hypothetical protein